MDKTDAGGQSQSQGPKPKNSKVMIALLGVTGAGKSTFINVACGREVLKISHGAKPCTQDPKSVEFQMDDRTIVLIDTPGFDDDKRSDVRILEDIAIWMAKKGYMGEQMLDGLIFLHPVTLTRAGGSELSRTQLLEKILGPGAYNRVFIATTMWDYIVNENLVKERLESRFAEGGVWHELKSKGAADVKHHNTQESAHAIIRSIIEIADRMGKPEIRLENELKKEKGRLVQTSAGKTLEGQITEKILILEDEICKHGKTRPPASYRNDKVSEHRTEWKRWHSRQRELQGKLARREQELKKLQNIIVRFFRVLAAMFRPPR
ncbi:P-loop containing nucleoside triphosphate hydrolase protein [Lasiosphaeris hirsuta]|uniref:P-loop containing nucleoside triphosphate hydrolase protein n=1 Tax=Lasiosphaeris hirsuta TaxID=260670 RepID=A0AA40DPX9_9PEZI|nr:P-loop containing nucleoside triphosphate hydrolase protein [Lasiosphaeris hirsuta]